MNDPIAILLRASVHHFIGHLGKDPEMRYLDSGKCVANVNIGVNWLSDKDQTDWIKLEVWGDVGQHFADACRKGYQVHVAGRVKTDRWTDRSTGEEKMQVCCRVESWKIVATPQGGGAPAQQGQAPAQPAQRPELVGYQPPAAGMTQVGAAPTQHPAHAAAGWNSAPQAPAPTPAPELPSPYNDGIIPF